MSDELNPQPKPLPFLENMTSYLSSPNKVADEGFTYRLCYNEGAFGPSPKALEAITATLPLTHRYPDMVYSDLRKAVAQRYNLDEERIIAGAGSDELISVLVNGYLKEGDEVIISKYAFSMYEVAARLVGAKPIMIPENDLQMDLAAMLKAVTPKTRMVFMANPNNPTGSWLARSDIQHFLRDLREDIIFVYDAAYADYVDDEDYSDGFEWVAEEGRVVVLRTFSKIHGLGGMRVGYAYAPKKIATCMNLVRKPFNVSRAGEAAAIASLNDDAFIERSRAHNTIWREKLFQKLQSLGAKPYPSKANFVLVRFASPEQSVAMFKHLKANSILVRSMAGYGLIDCLRFTVGQEHEMLALFAALKSFNWK